MQQLQLRGRQVEFVPAIARAVAQHKHVIACYPTGGGKTVCFVHIALSAIAKGKTVLILTESRKIFTQITAGIGGIEINAKGAKVFGVLPNKVYIAMAQTLARRPLLLSQFHDLGNQLLIISDEAHISTSAPIQRKFFNALQVGFTATPDFRSAKHLPEIYKECVVGAQVSDIIQDGYLMPYRHYARVGADFDKLKIKSGDFTEESQLQAFGNSTVFEGLLEDLSRVSYRKAMIFCSSIEHANNVHAELEYNGHKASVYHSQLDDAAYQLGMFEHGENNICVSVAALNKGYDHPPIDLTCLLFRTTSLPRYLQSIGRASRLCAEKQEHICLDYGMNFQLHGLWDTDRDWQTMWKQEKRKRKKDGEGVAPVKSCPECGYLMTPSTMLCPECGHLFEPEQKEAQVGDLVELTESFNLLRGRSISTLTAPELALYAKVRNKKAYAIRIARSWEQRQPGWLDAFRQQMNYKEGWLHFQLQSLEKEPIEFHDIVIK